MTVFSLYSSSKSSYKRVRVELTEVTVRREGR